MSHEDVTNEARSTIGTYLPHDIGIVTQDVDASLYERWSLISGLSATVSDILDELGYQLSVPSTLIPSVFKHARTVGRAITLRYLPERKAPHLASGHLAHKAAMQHAAHGDVLVIEGDHTGVYSVFGGLAAERACAVGLSGVLVDGAVRDVDQIGEMGLAVWSRGITAISGRGRLEGVGINVPIQFGNVQVCAGDIVVADESGLCFIPPEAVATVARRLEEIVAEESGLQK